MIELVSTEVVADALRLRWVAEEGVEYRIAETGDLGGAEWTEVTIVLGEEEIEEISIPLVPDATRFFRIEVASVNP